MAFFAIAFCCFPSMNMSPDAITYAADVKYGNDIFTPHHLLYNALHWCFYNLALLFNPHAYVVDIMQLVTAVISVLTLGVTYKTLCRITDNKTSLAFTIFIGCCFGFIRYSLECEVYVTPILFSVWSSYWFVRYLKEDKTWLVILTGVFASIAVLFHQIHIFWGIGLFAGLLIAKRYKGTAIYAICTLSVLICYSIVLVCYEKTGWSVENLFKYLASYYYSDGAANGGIGVKNFIMTPISLVRTFLQVHGDMTILLKMSPVLYAVFAIIPLLVFLLVKFIKSASVRAERDMVIVWTHVIIFALQFLFAVYSDGNAEFMVMLPFAMMIVLAALLNVSAKFTVTIAAAMFVWNFAFAVWPNNHYNKYKVEEFVEYIHSHPDENIIALDAATCGSINYLWYGEYDIDRVIYIENAKKGEIYITDMVDRPVPFNRQKFTEQTSGDFEVLSTVDTICADYGTYHLFKVKVK